MANKNKKKGKIDEKKVYAIFCAVLAVLLILIGISVYSIVKDRKADEKPSNEESAQASTSVMQEKIKELNIEKNPVATIEMENGKVIKAELYPEIAPNTVCNFISLANSGFYDGTIFHRCIKDFMIQGGDPEGTGTGGPGYSIAGEFTANNFKNDLKHERGVLSMARANPYDSGGSQFFIMVADNAGLDGQYASFGKVIEGMDVADEIVAGETDENDRPLTQQVMKKVSVETFGVEYPQPEKIN